MLKNILLVFLCLLVPKVSAADVSSISMVASKTQVSPGENITYTLTYSNNSDKDLSDVVVSMDMDVANGLNFVNSSLPQFWNGSKPYWRISDLASGTSSTVTITVNVSSDFSETNINGAASISADAGGELINSNSNAVGVVVVKPQDEKKEEEKKEEDEVTNKDKTDEKTTESTDKEDENKVIDMKADGVGSLVVDDVVGVANIANYSKNINSWDNRFLWVGLISFSLVLVIGILAFVLGRRVK